ncbi:hypothetical protein [Sinosporangium siamense]|uniref:hypothetical protein n=1 Tax=Sinosporangium siamense TaxID=1367973 RepID=UPI00194FE38D|nr:hypothetical protein [Sinosporangium siamense]
MAAVGILLGGGIVFAVLSNSAGTGDSMTRPTQGQQEENGESGTGEAPAGSDGEAPAEGDPAGDQEFSGGGSDSGSGSGSGGGEGSGGQGSAGNAPQRDREGATAPQKGGDSGNGSRPGGGTAPGAGLDEFADGPGGMIPGGPPSGQ